MEAGAVFLWGPPADTDVIRLSAGTRERTDRQTALEKDTCTIRHGRGRGCGCCKHQAGNPSQSTRSVLERKTLFLAPPVCAPPPPLPLQTGWAWACPGAPRPLGEACLQGPGQISNLRPGVPYARNLCPALGPIPPGRDCLGKKATLVSVEKKDVLSAP